MLVPSPVDPQEPNHYSPFMVLPMSDIEPTGASFGAVVHNVELRSLDAAAFHVIHEAWLEYGLLIFPGQFFSTAEQDTFARRFGDLEFEATVAVYVNRPHYAKFLDVILPDPQHRTILETSAHPRRAFRGKKRALLVP